jgi:transposase
MRKRRTFSREFKREAATMVLDQGHPLAHICLQLDVSKNSLRRWVQQVQFERNGGVPETKALTDEQREIQKLKARINELERDKSILKKATALLVSEEINR